jgi:salicylate hydroxylase
MPPQGESIGLALEDSLLFPRILAEFSDKPLSEVFAIYEKNRRSRIDDSWADANKRWENVKDKSWLQQKIIEWLTSWFLWWKGHEMEARFKFDVLSQEIKT